MINYIMFNYILSDCYVLEISFTLDMFFYFYEAPNFQYEIFWQFTKKELDINTSYPRNVVKWYLIQYKRWCNVKKSFYRQQQHVVIKINDAIFLTRNRNALSTTIMILCRSCNKSRYIARKERRTQFPDATATASRWNLNDLARKRRRWT